jgi:hypothetical protein
VYGVPRPEELSRQQIEEKLEEYLRDWQKKATTPPTISGGGPPPPLPLPFRLAYGQPPTIQPTSKFQQALNGAPSSVQRAWNGIINHGEWSPLRLRRVSRGCIHYQVDDHVIVLKDSGQGLQAWELRKVKASGGSSANES